MESSNLLPESGTTKKHMIPLNRKKQVNGVVEVIDISNKYIDYIKKLHNTSGEILDNIEDLEINKINKIITHYEKIIDIINS
jgi:hypothetical protein